MLIQRGWLSGFKFTLKWLNISKVEGSNALCGIKWFPSSFVLYRFLWTIFSYLLFGGYIDGISACAGCSVGLICLLVNRRARIWHSGVLWLPILTPSFLPVKKLKKKRAWMLEKIWWLGIIAHFFFYGTVFYLFSLWLIIAKWLTILFDFELNCVEDCRL